MLKRFYLILTALLMLTSAMSDAQTTTKPLSLDEAIKLGVDNSKMLKMSQAKVDVMKARAAQVKSQFIPNVGVSATYQRISDNIKELTVPFPGLGEFTLNPQILNQFYNRASVQYPVFTGFRAINTLKSLEYLERATELDYAKDESDVRNNIINAYLNHYKTLQSQKILTSNLKLYQSRLKDVNNFVEQGIALRNDQLRAQLGVSTLETNQAEIQSAVDISNYNLDLMLGLPTTTILEITDTAIATQEAMTLDNAFQSALTNRTEIAAANERVQSADAAIKTSQGAYYPTLSLFGNYYYNKPNQRVFPPEDKFKDTWDAGATLSWSVTQLFTNKSNVREATANFEQANALVEQLSDAVRMDVNASYSNYMLAKQKITLAQSTLEQAQENQRVMQNRYDNSTALYTDLEEADALLLQAQLNLVNAKTDAATAYYKLQKSIGK